MDKAKFTRDFLNSPDETNDKSWNAYDKVQHLALIRMHCSFPQDIARCCFNDLLLDALKPTGPAEYRRRRSPLLNQKVATKDHAVNTSPQNGLTFSVEIGRLWFSKSLIQITSQAQFRCTVLVWSVERCSSNSYNDQDRSELSGDHSWKMAMAAEQHISSSTICLNLQTLE